MKKDYVFLHLTMLLMSFTGVISKFAAQYEFLSLPFISIGQIGEGGLGKFRQKHLFSNPKHNKGSEFFLIFPLRAWCKIYKRALVALGLQH